MGCIRCWPNSNPSALTAFPVLTPTRLPSRSSPPLPRQKPADRPAALVLGKIGDDRARFPRRREPALFRRHRPDYQDLRAPPKSSGATSPTVASPTPPTGGRSLPTPNLQAHEP